MPCECTPDDEAVFHCWLHTYSYQTSIYTLYGLNGTFYIESLSESWPFIRPNQNFALVSYPATFQTLVCIIERVSKVLLYQRCLDKKYNDAPLNPTMNAKYKNMLICWQEKKAIAWIYKHSSFCTSPFTKHTKHLLLHNLSFSVNDHPFYHLLTIHWSFLVGRGLACYQHFLGDNHLSTCMRAIMELYFGFYVHIKCME